MPRDTAPLFASSQQSAVQFRTKAKQFAFLATPTQKSPEGILLRGDVVEDVRTVFETKNDTTIYIPLLV